jgi:hypothetical protein
LRRRSRSPAAASRLDSGDAEVQSSNAQLGKLLGGEVELLRVMWWSEVQQSGRSTVRPRRLRGGGKKEAAALAMQG